MAVQDLIVSSMDHDLGSGTPRFESNVWAAGSAGTDEAEVGSTDGLVFQASGQLRDGGRVRQSK